MGSRSGAQKRVVVVGGGLAGLAAAWRLQSAGARVTLCEASGRFGGRLSGETLGGIEFDPVPCVLPASAPELFGLVRELGLSERIRRATLDRVGTLRGGRTRTISASIGEALRWHALRGPRLRRLQNLQHWLGGELDPRAPDRNHRLDDRSVSDFCQVYLGARVRDRLLRPLFEACFGLDADDTSRELLFMLLSPSGEIPLSLATGLHALPQALAARLHDARCDARVVALADACRSVRLENGEKLDADAVLLATPATQVAKLAPGLSPAQRDALESSRYGNVLHLAVLLEGRGPARPLVWIPRREGGELAGVLDVTPEHADVRLLLLVARPTLFERHGHRPDDELAGLLLESAARVVPGIRRRLRTQRLLRLEQAVPRFGVGRYRQVARLLDGAGAAPGAGRLFLCGDHLVGPHAEAAVASAHRAADACLNDPAPRS